MDLSSQTTQRSNPSDTLAIQPGSLRAPMVDAAGEFARHLAENSQTDDTHRREDRSPEKRERPESRERTARDDKTESRSAARKTTDEKSDKTDETAEPQTLLQPAMAPTDEAQVAEAVTEESTKESQAADVAEMTDSDPANEAGESPTAISAEAGTANAPAAVAADVTVDASAQIVRDTVATASPGAKPADHSGAIPPGEPATPSTPGMLGDPSASAETSQDTATTKSATAAPKSATPAIGLQAGSETSSSDAAPADAAEMELVVGTKPAKGLGQAAADQLAEKKNDTKLATAQNNAAIQVTATLQPQRSVAPAQLTATTTDTATAQRSGDPAIPGTTPVGGTGTSAATVRIGTLPGQSQPTQIPSTAIALQMARNLQKGISRFDIRLDPPEMGRIDIRMEVRKDGHVAAHMTVDRPETLDLLQRDARALQQALNNAGLQADSDSLNFSLRDQNAESDRRDFASGERGTNSSDTAVEEPALSPAYNVNLSANGGVDIRV
ncbi:MAG: flagellar hook-length control protein FliK [Parvibaculum sp.]